MTTYNPETILDQVNSSGAATTPTALHFSNLTDDEHVLYPLGWVIPITVVYAIIFITGIVGNISTCIVIARNKSLHTVTNYYLFSIAISDLLLLISGLPPEMYRIWSPETYVFGEVFCVLQGFFAETSANATVLAITAFTVERYLAICHPFLSHTMSNLSRAIKYIIAIWIIALCLAAPQAIQFGVEYETKNGFEYSRCTVITTAYMEHAFEISTFLFFVGPMSAITVLYIFIAIKLRKSRLIGRNKRCSVNSNVNGVNGGQNGALGNGVQGSSVIATSYMDARAASRSAAQNRVIKMLVAVVVAFCICWAPFHGQRLLAVYLAGATEEAQAPFIPIYIALMYISGVLYFLSTSVNPVLYHIMSNKFREAFTATFSNLCHKSHRHHHCIYDPNGQHPQLGNTGPHRTYSTIIPTQGGGGGGSIGNKATLPPNQRPYQRSVSDGIAQFHPLLCATSGARIPPRVACHREGSSPCGNGGGASDHEGGTGRTVTAVVGEKRWIRPIVMSEVDRRQAEEGEEEYCLQLKERNGGGSFRARGGSGVSQTTVMTNYSNTKDKRISTHSVVPNVTTSAVNTKAATNEMIKELRSAQNARKRSIGHLNGRRFQTSYVSRIAQWLNVFQRHKRRPMDIHGNHGENGESKRPLREAPARVATLMRQGSVESSTISNSSLQDLEEMEFSSTDLMRYMEEINEDIA